MSEIRTCVTCSHIGEQPPEAYNPHADPHGFTRQVNRGPECKSPAAITRDLVFGKAFCINERNNNKGCGKKGKLWEPRTDAK